MVHFATLENIAALVFLVLFTLFTAWMTVVAYRDGKDGHIECLKKDCRMIGCSVFAIAMFSLAIGFETCASIMKNREVAAMSGRPQETHPTRAAIAKM